MDSANGTFRGYFLVRDREGKPKFDDIFDIPNEFWWVLTPEEKAVIIQERQDHGSNS